MKKRVMSRSVDGTIRQGYYTQRNPETWAKGSEFGPLQCDGYDYLCPECGGYGYLYNKDARCGFCKGVGRIALDDPRLTTERPNKEVSGGRSTSAEAGCSTGG